MITTTNYDRALKKVKRILEEYDVEWVFLNKDNAHEYEGHPNYDIEPEDVRHLVNGYQILVLSNWLLSIGHEVWQVRGLNMETDNDWCDWRLSMVALKRWHSMSIRLIDSQPFNKEEADEHLEGYIEDEEPNEDEQQDIMVDQWDEEKVIRRTEEINNRIQELFRICGAPVPRGEEEFWEGVKQIEDMYPDPIVGKELRELGNEWFDLNEPPN